MAQDLSEKELLRMEVEQLKKEVKNPFPRQERKSRIM
ncbi:guanine nucleotide binding protein (G protein), gamma transducing activity polypeptide 2, isoform CRA_d [Mus musculus]|nr:guanine nucleotide binding protein (G protein), gamma transducing activity polypeptide 2, isoform CRA_d [Mus musculus]